MDNLNGHGGNIYQYDNGIIDFSANINPLGLGRKTKEALIKNLDRILHYPDPDSRDLIKGIARYWKIDEENILLGNGSSELIYLIASTFKPKKVFIPIPTFSEYERASRAIGSKVQFIPLTLTLSRPRYYRGAGAPDPCSGMGAPKHGSWRGEGEGIDMLFVCNPNNPTGNLVRIPEFNGLKVIDEAFMDFLPDENRHTMIRKATKNKKIIVIRTFTKFFAVPGLRIGYLIAQRDIITMLKQRQPPWNINSLAQMISIMLEDKEYIRKTRRVIAEEREFLLRRLSNVKGLKPFNSATNFILVKINNKDVTSTFLKEKLIQKGVLIRDCSNFRGLTNKYFRIAIRLRKENGILINALGSIL